MPRPKPDSQDLKDRRRRATEWRAFRREFLFSQIKLAEILLISRRTVQMVEAGKVTPQTQTLRQFNSLKAKYVAGRAA